MSLDKINDASMRYIDTNIASVKMSSGVPVNLSEDISETDSEDEVPEQLNKDLDLDLGLDLRKSNSHNSLALNARLNKEENLSSIKSSAALINENADSMVDENIPEANSSLPNEAILHSNHSKSSPDKKPSSQDLKVFKYPDSTIFNSGSTQDIPAHMLINSDKEYKLTNHRFNPFNQIPMIEEDHFSDSHFTPHSTSYGSSSPRSFQNVDGFMQGELFASDVSFAELGLAEDHFSHPQGHFGLSGVEELELAIDNCKDMIREAEQGSEKQKNLVMKLVQLRIKLQEMKDGPEPVAEDVKVILSHKMVPKTSRTSKYFCERCNGVIWGMVQYWYRCSECGFRCHEKCLQQILRTCAKAKILDNQPLITEICPKECSDLASQTYRCAECRSAISFKTGQSEPRLCDYTGRYFCEYCHWNDAVIIPARVLHNWDFSVRKVSRASKQFLKLMQQKPVIRIQDINPMLFVYVDQLNEIKKLREEMMVMKKYIISCPSAMDVKLLLLLEKRQHFVESSDRYSMQDLLDAEEVLLPELVSVHSAWAQHIKVDCKLCQGRGFCCELCNDNDILFPFDNIAVVCAKCSNVLHRHCFAKKSVCPRCERREKRKTPN